MIARLEEDSAVTAVDYNQLVDVVNDLLASRESRMRAEAFDLLVRMVSLRQKSGGDLPLALAHTSHDGEQIIAHLMDMGWVDIFESRLRLTAAGDDQVRMAMEAAADDA